MLLVGLWCQRQQFNAVDRQSARLSAVCGIQQNDDLRSNFLHSPKRHFRLMTSEISPIGKDAESTRADQDILQNLMSLHSQYHNHKEAMAFSIFGLEGAFFVGLFIFTQWPPYVQQLGTPHLVLLFFGVWILFHLALRFQLRNRRVAAVLVAACYDALTKPISGPFSRKLFKVQTLPLDVFVDVCLLPVRNVTREADVAPVELMENETPEPRTLRALYFYLAQHRLVAATSWRKYAYPIDWITSFGSIVLLTIALARVVSLHEPSLSIESKQAGQIAVQVQKASAPIGAANSPAAIGCER